jgi:uncharacterized membrane protein
MSAMEQASAQPKIQRIIRWLIPIAAILAFGTWFAITPSSNLLDKADAIGYAICHRIDERSFHVGERQLPLCARCTGEFNAAAISLLFFAFVSRKKSGMPGWKLGAPLLLFFIAFGIDGSNSYLYLLKQTAGAFENIPNLYTPNNTLRLITGSGMGIALASILFPAFNQTVWQIQNPERALDWKKLAALIGIIALIDMLILTENSVILYTVSLVSVLGVLALLIIVFSMAWLLIMKQENAFNHLREMWMPFLAGTTLAFLMIAAIDLLRFNLTGTWGGIPLG